MSQPHLDPRLLLEHGSFVRALVRSLIADEHQASDVEQQTWLAALERPPQFERARAYLAVIAKNFVRRRHRDDERRRHALERLATREALSPSRDEILEHEAQRRRVIEAVLRLDEKYRAVVVLRYLSDLTPIEIASTLDLPLGSVKTRLKRALAQLREQFDTEDRSGDLPWREAVLPLIRFGTRIDSPAVTASLGLVPGAVAVKTFLLAIAGAVVLAVASLWWWSMSGSGSAPAHADPTNANEATAPAIDDAAAKTSEHVDIAENEVPVAASSRQAVVAEEERRLIRGSVKFDDGTPARGARVEARRNSDDLGAQLVEGRKLGPPISQATTDEHGEFAIDPREVRLTDLLVTHDTRWFAAVEGAAAGERHDLVLERFAVVQGRITRKADGSAVSAAELRVFNPNEPWRERSVRPNVDGTYAFTDLVHGEFSLAVEASDLADPPWTKLNLEPGAVHTLDFALEDGIMLHGRVIDAITREPIRDAEISSGWTFRSTVRSDADGNYEFRGFLDSGVPDVHCRAAGYGRIETQHLALDPATKERRIDFELKPARTARGILVDRMGRPVAGARVTAFANAFVRVNDAETPDGSLRQAIDSLTTQSKDDGSFEIANLRPDAPHALHVEHRSHGTTVYDFPADEATQRIIDLGVIPLAPRQRIVGRLLDSNERSLARSRLTLEGTNADRSRWSHAEKPLFQGYVDERSIMSDLGGTFVFDNVAPGTYRITYARHEGAPQTTITVAVPDGQDVVDLTMRIPAPHYIRGRIESAAGMLPRWVNVTAMRDGSEFELPAATAARPDGTFELIVDEPGRYTLRADPVGKTPNGRTLLPGTLADVEADGENVVLRLELAATIDGRVVDAQGQPLTNGHVVLRDARGTMLAWTVPDATGSFSLVVQPGQEGVVQAREIAKQEELLADSDPSNDDTGWSDSQVARAGDAGLLLTLPAR